MDLIADAGRPALGIDLLGHGTAAKPHDPAAYADIHLAVLEQLPPTPVDAIGFSLGSRVLLQCAIQDPSRFSRLVLTGVGTNLFEVRSDHHEKIAAAIEGRADPTDPFSRYFTDLANDPDGDPEALRALLKAPSSRLTPQDLAPLDMPVLVLLGDNDFAGPADPLVEALPHATFIELRNCDHFATPRSMQCLEAALEFVDASPF
jgi:pimeloyl-ACP methyl ester carboxylesterase